MDQKKIKEIAKVIIELQQQAVVHILSIWKPEVERIINSKSKDSKVIEHALDALCEVAFDDEALLLFKKLCRYYYDIDQLATEDYIQFYRERWDNEVETESIE